MDNDNKDNKRRVEWNKVGKSSLISRGSPCMVVRSATFLSASNACGVFCINFTFWYCRVWYTFLRISSFFHVSSSNCQNPANHVQFGLLDTSEQSTFDQGPEHGQDALACQFGFFKPPVIEWKIILPTGQTSWFRGILIADEHFR